MNILSILIQLLSSISKTLSTVARRAMRFGFNCACSSKKLILRKVTKNNTESLKTAVRNKTGNLTGHIGKASHIAIKDLMKCDLTMFVLLNKENSKGEYGKACILG